MAPLKANKRRSESMCGSCTAFAAPCLFTGCCFLVVSLTSQRLGERFGDATSAKRNFFAFLSSHSFAILAHACMRTDRLFWRLWNEYWHSPNGISGFLCQNKATACLKKNNKKNEHRQPKSVLLDGSQDELFLCRITRMWRSKEYTAGIQRGAYFVSLFSTFL